MRRKRRHLLFFIEKEPLTISIQESWKEGLEDRLKIATRTSRLKVEIHLRREDLKRLFLVIRERLKGKGKVAAAFTEKDEFLLSKDGIEFFKRPAAEVIKKEIRE
ncbi:hypothetical protein ES703_04020 [subsurface metagenome]